MIKKVLTSLVILTVILLGVDCLQSATAAVAAKGSKVTKAAAYQAAMSPRLRTKLNSLSRGADSAGVVIISFNTPNGLRGVKDLDKPKTGFLARHKVKAGARFQSLGMIAAVMTKAQVQSIAADRAVKSLWDNYRLYYNLHQARVLCGVDKLRADAGMTADNGGHVVDGSGAGDPIPNADPLTQPNRPQFSVLLIDSGIDTTGVPFPTLDPTTGLPYEADLKYDNSSAGILNANIPPDGYTVAPTIPATKVIQNVQGVGDEALATIGYAENQLNDDSVGHGSHCAGIIGSLGTFSRHTPALTGPNASPTGPGIGQTEDFSGVANGVKIVGYGSGIGLFVLDALGGFEYGINFQNFYNIRVTSNSYGSIGAYDPADPLNLAIEEAYNRGITSVFAAGNSGPGVDTISNSSKSPYVICVAAGTKEGGLASFSSRGIPEGERTPGSPNEFNLPAITAPGTGREFEYNAAGNATGKGFYTDMISTQSKLVGAAHGTNDQEFPVPYQANYTQISGTSMACPFVAGTCALLLDADPTLTPAGIKSILQTTATIMPGYSDYEVGAGYLNVFAAVDKALHPAKPYATFALQPADFNAEVVSSNLPPPPRPLQDDGVTPYPPATVEGVGPSLDEDFTLEYHVETTPSEDYDTAKAHAASADSEGQPNMNCYAFSVVPDAGTGKAPSVLDVRIQFGQESLAYEVGGNSLGLYLWAPDGTFYSSGLALPVLDAPNREVVVKNPMQGLWIAELRPVRGLAAVPITPPTGLALPDTTTGQIYRTNLTVTDPPDITEVPQKEAIEFALANRYLDTRPDGTFQPTEPVTRADFAEALALNTPIRQSLASSTPKFADANGRLGRIAEALDERGSTLRDWDFTVDPTLSSGVSFLPGTSVSRVQTAISLVRALGLDTEARELGAQMTTNGTHVQVTYNGTATDVADDGNLDASAIGYVQMAVNRGILNYFVQRPPGGSATIYLYPSKPLIRADLAVAINAFRQVFSAGNSLYANETTITQVLRAPLAKGK